MPRYWDQAELERYISQGTEESLTLDYKAGMALSTEANRQKEIAKDVSAMANSAGGVIIYGIGEDQTNGRYKPAQLVPVDRRICSRETLEQIISSNIQPRISGIKIYPVPLSTGENDVAYVVSIPQSDTVHQVVRSKRYYKRFNFESVPMEDFEIRDVLNRLSSADVISWVGQLTHELDPSGEGQIWSIPLFVKNRSMAVARDSSMTVEFIDIKSENRLTAEKFVVKTQLVPQDYSMYISSFQEAIHRGLDKYFGTFQVYITGSQTISLRIQLFSDGMRAKYSRIKLNFGGNSSTIQVEDEGYLY
ncbi:MAG: helix-turn-helix domain-containing protein [Anaerolineae bacterium]